ncbi:dihydroxy-acid dehydratase [uncultured Jatrophihabitans sp.]|uniref:dihydroxy-acid dehydratase n=1 Tax=uncultured Jatrophihabitans sp. TaxID=1610747 RepID=UPI0035CC3E3A
MAGQDRHLRSQRWYDDTGVNGFLQRSALRVQGLREKDYQRPVIGIANNTSDFNRCHTHFDSMVTAVKESVLAAGGRPREFNTMTLGADLAYPLGMTFLHRNLLSMEVEQMAELHGVDGLVMLGACDETIPAMLMAAASIDLPTIVIPGGPSFSGFWRGRDVGSGYDCHRAFEALGRGELTPADITDLECSLERSPGHCSTMGTAGTMTTLAEALGMAPAGSSAIPAVDSRRLAMCRDVGELIMHAVADDLRPSHVMTSDAFRNAVRVLAAIDGSANGVLHLLAIAGRLDVDLKLIDFDELSATTPVLLNMRPSGQFYYTDFFNAGGVPALMNALGPLLNREVLTVTGRTLGAEIDGAVIRDERVIGTLENPVSAPRGIAVLTGNLAPDGAIVRTGVASPALLTHRGRAVVFQSKEEQDEQLYKPDFDIRPGDVVVVLNGGPRGSAGMPETARIQVPDKLLSAGVTDLVRLTDGRVGGTVSGTAVLQVTPEAAVGGPIGLLRTGDMIRLDVPGRRVDVELSDVELAARRAEAAPDRDANGPQRGYGKLYVERVTQADTGCDFDFMRRVNSG